MFGKVNENRSKHCFDSECEILFNVYDEDSHNKGYSYFCFGKLKEPRIFTEKECEHINEYCHCVYTPLKGALRFYINKNDAWIYQLGVCQILNNAVLLYCDECGFIHRAETLLICHNDGSKLCPLCSLRLGKKTWNDANKKYI